MCLSFELFLKAGLIQTLWVKGRGRAWGYLWGNSASSPSRDMPTERHFLKRHCWQRLRLMRTMEQFSFFRHLLYWMFCWMLRRKKPWKAGAASEHLCLRQTYVFWEGVTCPCPFLQPASPCSPRRHARHSGSPRQRLHTLYTVAPCH